MKNKNLITTFSTKYNQNRNFCPFWATVCKTVRPMLSDRCPVCLSVCPVCPVCPVCNVGALWPNGWTDQDENWQASALATLCKMGTQLPPKKEAEPPIFGPYLLWPNGWMDQDGIWHGGRPRLRRHCVRWDLAAPKRGTAPSQFLAHVYCGQMARWIRMPLGTEVGLGPDDIVLDGAQLPQEARPPIFGRRLLWSTVAHLS